jgi:hypothetical protein
MTGPKRIRAPEPDTSPASAPGPEPAPGREPVPRDEPRTVERRSAAEAAPHEFVWPPPAAEIDALEVVHLTPLDDNATPHVWSTPARSGLTRGDLNRLAQLTRGDTLERGGAADRAGLDRFGRARFGRERIVRAVAMIALIAVSMTVGIFLGARHARRAMVAEQAVSTAPAAASASRSPSALADATPARPPDATPPTPTVPARTPERAGAPRVAAPATTPSAVHATTPPPRTITSAAPSPAPLTDAPPAASSPAPQPSTTSASTTLPAPSAFQTGGATQVATRLPESRPTAGLGDTLQTLTPVSSPARRAEASGVVGRTADAVQISETLARYAHAYTTLDARAARAAWPSLDVAALSRAFSSLKSQTMTFDRCTVQSVGYDTATASCDGSTTVVRRVGHPTPIVEPLEWTFTLRRDAGAWVINTVRVRR